LNPTRPVTVRDKLQIEIPKHHPAQSSLHEPRISDRGSKLRAEENFDRAT
jgi:hypothetical protein